MSLDVIDSLNDLKSSVADELLRAGDDTFSARLPRIIQQAEQQIERQLRVPEMEATATIALVQAQQAVNVPADFLDPLSLRIGTNPGPLDKMEMQALDLQFGWQTAAMPRAYALFARQFVFGPVPDTAYSATLRYYKKLPRLTDAAPTNSVFSAYWDIYFYATLLAAAPGLADDARIATWTQFYGGALATANEISNGQNVRSYYAGAKAGKTYGKLS